MLLHNFYNRNSTSEHHPRQMQESFLYKTPYSASKETSCWRGLPQACPSESNPQTMEGENWFLQVVPWIPHTRPRASTKTYTLNKQENNNFNCTQIFSVIFITLSNVWPTQGIVIWEEAQHVLEAFEEAPSGRFRSLGSVVQQQPLPSLLAGHHEVTAIGCHLLSPWWICPKAMRPDD